jgi:hypothetical protein
MRYELEDGFIGIILFTILVVFVFGGLFMIGFGIFSVNGGL